MATLQAARAVRRTSQQRRHVEGCAFVALWMGLGVLVGGDAEAYLLLGIPLTAAFQRLVRRRPLRELWVRDGGPGAPPNRRDLAVVSLLAIAPVVGGVRAAQDGGALVVVWFIAAFLGAAAAAYALRATSILAVLQTAAWAVGIGVVANVVIVGGVQWATGASVEPGALLGSVLVWTATYYPATFLFEEVAFRGALDAHLHHPGEAHGLRSAVLVSALWGVWHLPVSEGMPWPLLIASLVAWHIAVGVPLSLAWRRSGNLSAPAFAHAAMDGVRNGLLGL